MEEIKNKKSYDSNLPFYQLDDKNDSMNKYRLDIVLDIRKFEIELYWKRATYFWTFIAAAYAGYGITFTKTITSTDFQFLISCLGFVLSVGWYLANKGSKFWHVNWETHLNLLEDDLVGPLHKTTINPKSYSKFWKPTAPYACSVSKINQILSFFNLFVWVILILNNFFTGKILIVNPLITNFDFFLTSIGAITIVFFIYILIGSKSTLKDTQIHFRKCDFINTL
jgi:hypothetical protein